MSRILIIDDETENLKALSRALSDENPDWEIFTAGSESKGLAILEKQFNEQAPIAVVLTDLVLDSQEQGGMNILKTAKDIDRNVMSILFTAREKNLDRYKAFELGAFDVVEKNMRGKTATHEINIKTRVALRYHYESFKRINSLSRYFDPKVFDMIEKNPELLKLNGRMLTVVFWDIRGFSRLCEILKTHPNLITGFLKDYYEAAANTIFSHEGVLDKFIGDGVMALFGVLHQKEDEGKADAISAVGAAIELNTKFNTILNTWMEKWQMYVPNKIEIGLGCGIHTEETLAGNIGTDFREQFTALGPPVNFASRIEARSNSGQILISQSTYFRVKTSFRVSSAGEISDVKNIHGKFLLYQVE